MNWIAENWEKVMIPITGIVAWFFTKRDAQKVALEKSEADVTGANLGNVTDTFKVYQNLINDLETRFKSQMDDLQGEIEELRVLNGELRSAVNRQEQYINKLKIKLTNYEGLAE